MQKFFPTAGNKVTAIIKCSDALPEDQRFKKYRHVDNTNNGISTFLAFVKKKFPDAMHCNFYNKEKGLFIQQILLE